MNNSRNNINNIYSFKKVIDDIINANLTNKGMVKYISAKVVGVNSNGTINVYIPPDNSNIVNGLANKSGEILAVEDSVELCTKNGSLKNAWVAVKHGINSVGGVIDSLVSTSTTDALSANMGRALNEKVNNVTTQVNNLSYDLKSDGVPVLTGRYVDGKPEYIVRISVPKLAQGATTADIPFTISKVNIIDIGGTIISNSNNVFSLDTANFNGGNNYVYLNDSLNKLAIQCQTGNYASAYVNIQYTMKGEE